MYRKKSIVYIGFGPICSFGHLWVLGHTPLREGGDCYTDETHSLWVKVLQALASISLN